MRITAGSSIGRYRIDELIGVEDTGTLYRAFDPRHGRRVALKILAPDEGTDKQDHVARFAQDARATALINHPNLVTVYDVGIHDSATFVVSELLDGHSLRSRLEDGPLPAASALGYARQIAEGLLAAHRLGLVHRDLRPENIFVTLEERVKILDFGLAQWHEEVERLQDPSRLAGAEMTFGSVGYMSPEQIRGHALDARSDLFSLGAILYEMVAGAPAFHKRSTIETLDVILRDDPPSLEGTDRVTSELEHVIRHCLEKDRGMRFQSARDLLFALDLTSPSQPRRGPRNRPRHDSLAWLTLPVGSLFRLL
jgi:eukaryotic-like serine/threonine-protein kinase